MRKSVIPFVALLALVGCGDDEEEAAARAVIADAQCFLNGFPEDGPRHATCVAKMDAALQAQAVLGNSGSSDNSMVVLAAAMATTAAINSSRPVVVRGR